MSKLLNFEAINKVINKIDKFMASLRLYGNKHYNCYIQFHFKIYLFIYFLNEIERVESQIYSNTLIIRVNL